MRRLASLIVVIALATPLLGGCASKQEVESIQARSRQDSEEQRRLIMQLEQELAEAREQLRQEIEKTNTPVAQKTADIWVELNTLRKEFATLKGDVEVMKLRLDREIGVDNATTAALPTVQERLEAMEFAMENQLNIELETVTAMEEAKAVMAVAAKDTNATAEDSNATEAVAAAAATTPATTPKKVSGDPAKDLYDAAMAEYKVGNYEKARSYWAEFTDTFKSHPYRASAIFWQGQCYYKLKDYARAALLYDDVIKKHPKSSKVPAAMLKQGYALLRLGKEKAGNAALDLLVKKFPDSNEAKQARNYLQKQ